MILDIPSAAIEPFEPHGMPKLNITDDVIWEAFSEALDSLNGYSKSISDAMLLRTMHYYIRDALDAAGAEIMDINIRGPYTSKDGKGIPVCHVTVDCRMLGGRMRHVGGPIWSTGGFV